MERARAVRENERKRDLKDVESCWERTGEVMV
jgi:hypothetical protein